MSIKINDKYIDDKIKLIKFFTIDGFDNEALKNILNKIYEDGFFDGQEEV